jgi:DNA-binding NtrC family response regulator
MKRERRILILDDDAGIVDYLVDALTLEGYAVEGTTSVQAALARVRDQRFDLVLSDVEMPEMRGVDVLHAIHGLRPNQLVMLITAFGSVELP